MSKNGYTHGEYCYRPTDVSDLVEEFVDTHDDFYLDDDEELNHILAMLDAKAKEELDA
jgi:hypothetical protein